MEGNSEEPVFYFFSTIIASLEKSIAISSGGGGSRVNADRETAGRGGYFFHSVFCGNTVDELWQPLVLFRAQQL